MSLDSICSKARCTVVCEGTAEMRFGYLGLCSSMLLVGATRIWGMFSEARMGAILHAVSSGVMSKKATMLLVVMTLPLESV